MGEHNARQHRGPDKAELVAGVLAALAALGFILAALRW